MDLNLGLTGTNTAVLCGSNHFFCSVLSFKSTFHLDLKSFEDQVSSADKLTFTIEKGEKLGQTNQTRPANVCI